MTKTFDKKDVFSVLNAEDASRYVGEKGYFADDLQTLKQNVEENRLYKLHKISANYTFPFRGEKEYDLNNFSLFLPANKVREEKTYRPFKDCAELCQYVRVTGEDLYAGLTLNIRNKENKIVRQVLVTEINYGKPFIGLGICLFDLKKLYRNYEWQDEDNGVWHPFGVEE